MLIAQLYSRILKLQNLRSAFDRFDDDAEFINDADMQDDASKYIDFHEMVKDRDNDHIAELIDENFSFEMDLEKQVEIGITYVLQLYSRTTTDVTVITE